MNCIIMKKQAVFAKSVEKRTMSVLVVFAGLPQKLYYVLN